MSNAPRLLPGERPLLAFVSSVMRPELQWARDMTVSSLTGNPALMPWAFEFTPAASEAADETYLAKVREADIVIWLVGAETTAPVRNEIAEAMSGDRRLWVIRLPAVERDADTDALLGEVGQRAKWADANTPEELRELLTLTFSDEVIRAIRGVPSLTRLARLEQVARASRERMIVRWQAAGLSRLEAIELADDPTVGEPPQDLLPTADKPLRVLVADVGTGKSVMAERALQQAVRSARERAAAPIPVFLHARDISGALEGAVLAAAQGLGDPRTSGCFLVIDGADETDQLRAAQILRDARVLLAAFSGSRAVITSRPLPALDIEERVGVPPLSEEAARMLVSRIAGRKMTVGMASRWPRPIADAIRRPLFAIIVGLKEREREAASSTTGALLDFLVTRALGPHLADEIPRLSRLARLSTDNGSGPVRAADLGNLQVQEAAVSSGLVVRRDEFLEFGLPILTQWFAAQSLMNGDPPVVDLLDSPERLEHWRYGIAVAVATGATAQINEIMEPIARMAPAFAAAVVEESVDRWGGEDFRIAMPSSVDAARELRSAFSAWREGAAPASDLFLPIADSGHLRPLAARTGERSLTFGWYVGGEADEVTLELPSQLNVFEDDSDWVVRRSGRWSAEPGWAWRWSLEVLRSDLARALKECALRVDDEKLVDEGLWLVALEVAGRGSLSQDPVPLDEVEAVLQDLDATAVISLRDRIVYVDQLKARVADLRRAGPGQVEPPWPVADTERLGGGWIWDPYSPAAQLERARAVYFAALNAYQATVETWFPRLGQRLQTYATLPARFVGDFHASSNESRPGPTIEWYLLALPQGSANEIDIQIDGDRVGEIDRRGAYDRLVELRPKAQAWIDGVTHHAIADVFQGAPLAPLVYDWLRSDLKRTGWGG